MNWTLIRQYKLKKTITQTDTLNNSKNRIRQAMSRPTNICSLVGQLYWVPHRGLSRKCLSIYLSINKAVIPIKGGIQDKAHQGSWRHYSLFLLCALSCRRIHRGGTSYTPHSVPLAAGIIVSSITEACKFSRCTKIITPLRTFKHLEGNS